MIQEIQPHIYENQYVTDKTPQPGDRVIMFHEGCALLKTAEALEIPTYGELSGVVEGFGSSGMRFLFAIDAVAYYLSDFHAQALGLLQPVDSITYRRGKPAEVAFACAVAEQLNRWYTNNRYCGSCGAALLPHQRERALSCPDCSRVIYPSIAPAVIVGVVDGERILLTRYAGRAEGNYALVAGYCEIGESVESTVAREVLEEVGLRVKDLRFYRSQPWMFSDTVLMGFFARLDGPDTVTLQEDELAEAQWHERQEVPFKDLTHISLTGEMIELFKHGEDPYALEKDAEARARGRRRRLYGLRNRQRAQNI